MATTGTASHGRRTIAHGSLSLTAALFLIGPPAWAVDELEWTHIRPSNTGIPGDYTHEIYVDDQGRPWITGYIPFWEEGGVAYPDGDGWVTISNVDYPQIISPRFNDIVQTPDGAYWIGSDHGLLRLDLTVGPEAMVRYDTSNSPMLGNQVRDLAVGPDGSVWMALDSVGGWVAGGLAKFQPGGAGVWQTWTTATGLPWGDEWPGWDWVNHVAIVPDAVGSNYTTWVDGPIGMAKLRDGVFTWYDSTVDPPFTPYPLGLYSNDPVDELGNIWMFVTPGAFGRLARDGSWMITGAPAGLGTEIARVSARSGGRAILTTYYADVFEWDGGWSYIGNWGGGTHTYAFAEEPGGAFWVGGIGGAARYEDGFFQRYRLTNTGMVGYFINTLFLAGDGDVYMNGNAGPGVGGFDIRHSDGTWTNANNATYGLGLPWGLPTDDVEDLWVREDGRVDLALSGIQGAVEWDGVQYRYLVPQGYDIVKIAVDGLGRVWAARYLSGLFLVTAPMQYVQYTSSSSLLPAGEIVEILPDAEQPGFVWIGSPFGIAHTDGDTWQVYPRELLGLTEDSLPDLITALEVDEDGTLWVGSGRGLFHFDPVTTTYVQYTPAGTALPSDDISNIEVAPDGAVWVATFDMTYPYPGGLTHFDGTTWTTWSAESSPLPHNQVTDLESRPAPGGYELWVATASEAVVKVFVPAPLTPGDIDDDGDVDLLDFANLAQCLAGPDDPPASGCPPSVDADLDDDGDVDLSDFKVFQASFTG